MNRAFPKGGPVRTIVSISVLWLAACASSGGGGVQQETVRVVDSGVGMQLTTHHTAGWVTQDVAAPGDAVWRALGAAHDSLGIPVTVRDERARTIGNDGLKLRRRLGQVPLQRYLDCGNTQGGPNAESYEVHLVVRTQVLPAGSGSSRVSSTVQAQARPVNFSGDWIRCTSRNTLEKAIAELAGRLAVR
jgi:hypothetical protein